VSCHALPALSRSSVCYFFHSLSAATVDGQQAVHDRVSDVYAHVLDEMRDKAAKQVDDFMFAVQL
jgi:hypothetical protein